MGLELAAVGPRARAADMMPRITEVLPVPGGPCHAGHVLWLCVADGCGLEFACMVRLTTEKCSVGKPQAESTAGDDDMKKLHDDVCFTASCKCTDM